MSADPIARRLLRLEAENALLLEVVARLAAFADPRARVAIVRGLTGPAAAIGSGPARSAEQNEIVARKARELLTMIASGAGGQG